MIRNSKLTMMENRTEFNMSQLFYYHLEKRKIEKYYFEIIEVAKVSNIYFFFLNQSESLLHTSNTNKKEAKNT